MPRGGLHALPAPRGREPVQRLLRGPSLTHDEQVAYALETEVELLPWIPELLADLPALGSDPDEVVELLRGLPGAGGATRVADLGCGKGAAAVAIAQELGHPVEGFDLFAPFIESARARAAAAGLEALCTFHRADLLRAIEHGPFDVALFLALGDVLGPLDETVGRLRRSLRPGGYLLIGDAFLRDPGSVGSGDYAGYVGHEETLARLCAHGDRVVREEIASNEDVAAENAHNNRMIAARAERLIATHPEIRAPVEAFVARQREECSILETEMVCATWLLERR